MFNLKSFVLLAAFIVSANFTFANNINNNETSSLRVEITDLLDGLTLTDLAEDITKLNMKFIVNDDNEIIVLSTSNQEVDVRIKSRLNYQKVATNNVQKNLIYSLPVTLVKK